MAKDKPILKVHRMSFLGISRDTGAVYIGESSQAGHRCSVEPFISPLRFLSGAKADAAHQFDEQDVLGLPRRIFREDSFDPVSRVRRGAVYHANGSQPVRWYAHDPYRRDLGNSIAQMGHRFEMELVSYQHDPLNDLTIAPNVNIRVALGKEPFVTTWKVVGIEATAFRTPVLTLKADSLFGDLPEIVPDAIPPAIRDHLTKALDDVASSMHRLSVVAVIDRCRDALGLIFGEMAGDSGLDLWKAAEAWAGLSNREDIRTWCAKAVARLHSRGKPNESISKQLPSLSEADAVFAVHCLGTVLREFGWVRR